MTTHKIAIITTREINVSDYDGYDTSLMIANSITDWDEVTHDEFLLLQRASYRVGFKIIERPVDAPAYIAKTIADYKAIAKAEEAKAAKEKKEREDAALARKFKKELKDKASKEKMLSKLAEELGVDLTGLPTARLPK
jgi:hypothetical protein